MMRYIVVIWFCLLSMLYSCVLYAEDANAQQYQAVSYTHLTLPTNSRG